MVPTKFRYSELRDHSAFEMADADDTKPPLEPVTTAETESPTSVSSWPSSQANLCEVEAGEVSLVDRRAITRKLDIHIIPIVVLLYLVNFLDRSISYPTPSRRGWCSTA